MLSNQSDQNVVKQEQNNSNTTTATSTTTEATTTTSSSSSSSSMESSTRNFQDDVRKWFTKINPDERAAALGFFVDSPMMSILASFSSATTTSSSSSSLLVVSSTNNDNKSGARSMDKLSSTESECYDWEARIALKIIEKTWEEIMMVGIPNTSGVNQKEFEKNSLKLDDDKKNVINIPAPIIDNVVSNTTKLCSSSSSMIMSMDKDKDNIITKTKIEDSSKDEKKTRKEKIKPDDGNDEATDAYRIPNEVIEDVIGIPASDTVNDAIEVEADVEADIDTDTDTVAIIKSTKKTGVERQGSDVALGVNKLGLVPPKESADTTSTSISPATHGIEAELQYISKKKTNNNKGAAEVIMDNTCCIFPSASKIATTTITTIGVWNQKQQQQQPFITINPSYLSSISGEDLLLVFDEIMAMACANDGSDLPSFILPDSTSDSWLELIHSYAIDATTISTKKTKIPVDPDKSVDCPSSTPSLSIPLYLLVISHFQLSLVKSYSAHNSIALSRQVISPSSSNNNNNNNNNNNIIEEIEKPSTMSEITIEQKDEYQSDWFPVFMDRIRELKKTEPTLVEKVRTKLSSKFPEAGTSGESNIDNKCNLEDYLLLPLPVVAGRLCSRNTNDISTDRSVDTLNNIDSSIEESLPNDWLVVVAKDGQSDEKDTTSAETITSIQNGDQIITDNTTPSDGNEDSAKAVAKSTPSVSGSKKSRKKKKKKKKKTAVGAVSISSTNAENEEKPAERMNEDKADTDMKCVETSVEKLPEKPVEMLLEENKTDVKKELVEIKDAQKIEIKEVETKKSLSTTEDATVLELKPVTPNISDDSDKSTISSVKSEDGKAQSKIPDKSEVNSGNDLHLSKRDDFANVVLVQPETPKEEAEKPINDGRMEDESSNKDNDQGDIWETVEVRPRGRKRISDKGGNFHTGNTNGQQLANSKKKVPRSKKERNRYQTRRIVKEIIGGVLDAVDEQVQRRRRFSRERLHTRRNQTTLSFMNNNSEVTAKKSFVSGLPRNSNTQLKKGGSMRDVLLGGKGSTSKQQHIQKTSPAKVAPFSYSERARSLMNLDSNEAPRNISGKNGVKKSEKSSHMTGIKSSKATRTLPADQNTIPTVASTNSAFTPSITNVTQRKSGIALSSESSTTGSVEAQKPKNAASDAVKHASPSPPLPTLLSPGNNNSTSSSVASSLDAPHAGHHGNLSRQCENDVGCHLLDVCDRLSTEISEFMKRREAALEIRRHERGLVLAALEKTLGLIWPGMPSVEMYGSCATNLDLPSSDLDVVVCGLDRPLESIPSPSNSNSNSNSASTSPKSVGNSSMVEDDAHKEEGLPKIDGHQDLSPYGSDQRYSSHQMSPHHMQMMYGHMSINAERVLRLAMELEHQPWAVHVKAIPTASVPVIKILADPARLQGAILNGNADWLVQQPINGQSTSMPPRGRSDNVDSHSGNQAPKSHYSSQQSSTLWRGADVVNGLLKVDITFEGPEHGGIGSTVFSKQVVQDFSNETELSPECTPHVQVLMVLKELLAQRRLNEPFSGGLSSYALLLLVISMTGERSIIREELEKTELQRRVVAAGGGNSALRSSSSDSTEYAVIEGRKQSPEKSQKKKKVVQTKSEDTGPKSTKSASHGKEGRIDVTKLRNSSSTKITGKSQESTKNTELKGKSGKPEQVKTAKKEGEALAPTTTSRKASVPSSSWASIARKTASTPNLPALEGNQDNQEKTNSKSNNDTAHNSDAASTNDRKVPKKPNSFADAVTKGKSTPVVPVTSIPKKTASVVKKNEGKKKLEDKKNATTSSVLDPPPSAIDSTVTKNEKEEPTKSQPKENVVTSEQAKESTNVHSSTLNQSKVHTAPTTDTSSFPQGFHDVIEVLCSGEATSGKLLMHFLLFYGQHFESQSTAIDYSGTHQRDAVVNDNGYSVRSSYLQRRNAGSYDPITGMLTVDPIVVYDPLEGAENNNVARSCFAWSSIRWVFAQSYMTLSSAAETNATTSSEGTRNRATTNSAGGEGPTYGHDESGHVVVDPSSPLLELLLSF